MITAAAIRRDGIIYIGRRHHLIMFHPAFPKGYFRGCDPSEQGFITVSGEFLNRKQALTYALECGQIEHPKYQETELFSEDLW